MSSLKKWLSGWRLGGIAGPGRGRGLAGAARAAGRPAARLLPGRGPGRRHPGARRPMAGRSWWTAAPAPPLCSNELGAVLPFWDRSLDLVVLTHPDGDHITGLIPLLDRYRVARCWTCRSPIRRPMAATWLENLAKHDVRRTYAQRGMRCRSGTCPHRAEPRRDAPHRHGLGRKQQRRRPAAGLRRRPSLLLTGDAEQRGRSGHAGRRPPPSRRRAEGGSSRQQRQQLRRPFSRP